jgi:uncharacterized protein YjiS (DUF1127 family)
MISITVSHRPAAASPSMIVGVLMGIRRVRMRAAQRKHLLSLDDYLLRDMGLERSDIMRGKF